jgi:hypothetical protein
MDNDHKLAVLAQLLYLANLLAVPGVALLLLWLLRLLLRDRLHALSRYHFRLALLGSGGALLILGIPALCFWLLGHHSPEAWTYLLLFLIVTHTTLVMFGIFALARAMTGRKLRN